MQEYEKVFKFQEYEKLSTRGEVQLFQFRLCKSMNKSMIERFQRERAVQLFELASGQVVQVYERAVTAVKVWKCESVNVWKWKYESENMKVKVWREMQLFELLRLCKNMSVQSYFASGDFWHKMYVNSLRTVQSAYSRLLDEDDSELFDGYLMMWW